MGYSKWRDIKAKRVLTQPNLLPTAWRQYTLAEDWWVEWRGRRFWLPVGFQSDGASVPRWAWSLSGLRPDGLIRAAALVHDALYRYGGDLPESWMTWELRAREIDISRPLPKPLKRKQADTVFYDLMRRAGIGRYRAWVAYRAVRMAGWASWKEQKD